MQWQYDGGSAGPRFVFGLGRFSSLRRATESIKRAYRLTFKRRLGLERDGVVCCVVNDETFHFLLPSLFVVELITQREIVVCRSII